MSIDDIFSSKSKEKLISSSLSQNFQNSNFSFMNNKNIKNNSLKEPYNDLYPENYQGQKTFISSNVYTQTIPQNLQNFNFSLMNKDISFCSMENKEKNEQTTNDLNNPYLKKEDVPELEMIDKNNIIFDKIFYEIKDYIEEINGTPNDFLDDEIYKYCGKCKNDPNKFFCFICHKNICNKCFKECEFNNHSLINLEKINYKNNINKIKTILNK